MSPNWCSPDSGTDDGALSHPSCTLADMEASSLRFAAAARTLAEVTRAAGLIVPGFRSPPRLDGVDRSLRRSPGPTGEESVTVSVRIKGRPWVSVLADMIDGVLVANRLEGPTAGAARTVLWSSVEADAMRGTDGRTMAVTSSRGRPGRRHARRPIPPEVTSVPKVA